MSQQQRAWGHCSPRLRTDGNSRAGADPGAGAHCNGPRNILKAESESFLVPRDFGAQVDRVWDLGLGQSCSRHLGGFVVFVLSTSLK